MGNFPLVSLIIPSYNYALTLEQCIDALKKQTYPHTEIIVVDDKSTDNSLSIAKQQQGVLVLENIQNSGVAATRNHGVRESQGEILFFVDADVVISPDAVQNAVTIMHATPGAVSVCGLYEPTPLIRDSLWEEFRSLQAYVWRKTSVGDVSGGFFSLGAISRDAYTRAGPFNTVLRQTEEIDYGERLTRIGRIILTDLVRGQHDDDHELIPMMKKFVRRSRDRVPFYLRRGKPMKGFELPRRLAATACSGVILVNLILSLLLPSAIAIAILFLFMMLLLENDVYREARVRLGLFKWPAFILWYLAFHISAGVGVAIGIAMTLMFKSFRNMYGSWDENPDTI